VARLTLMPNGVTGSFPRSGPLAEPPSKRGKVNGWSRQATARLRRWFYGVDGDALDGRGFALTLTIRDLPATAEEWTKTRERFMARLRRLGLIRGQWLTEWQRRGVPHLHGIVYFPRESKVGREEVIAHWRAAAAEFAPGESAQHVKPVWGIRGWLQYQAKHSARGVAHYQRASVPEAWQEGTGRLWGAVGDWPTREEVIEVAPAEYHRFRRLLRNWLIAGARQRGDTHRAAFLRRMLADPERKRAAVRAVGEFCPEEVSRRLLEAAQFRHRPGEFVDIETGEVVSGFAVLYRDSVVRLDDQAPLIDRSTPQAVGSV
jgi:hypothetical protein